MKSKMSQWSLAKVLFAAALAASAVPCAAIIAYRPLGQLTSEADAIIVATAGPVVASGDLVEVALTVRRVIKGELEPAVIVYGVWQLTDDDAARPAYIQGASGIWFLKQKTEAQWLLLATKEGEINLGDTLIPVPEGELSYDAGNDSDPASKIVSEIIAAAADQKTAPMARLMISLGLLDDLGPAALNALWSGLSVSSDRTSQIVGLSGLIRTNSPAAGVVLRSLTPMQLASMDARQTEQLALGLRLFRSADPESIAMLGALSNVDPLRSAAVEALRAIHTQETLPYLAAFLDSASAELRYQAVTGIASFANGFPIQTRENYASMAFLSPSPTARFRSTEETREHFPAVDTFAQNEQKYILFWKKWLADNQLVP
jgi:hypothetical protein